VTGRLDPVALARLASLAEAERKRDLARIEALAVEARGLEDEIAALGATQRRDAEEGSMPLAMVARRIAWTEAAIAAHHRRIAAIAQELVAARAAARSSVGRHEALVALQGRAEREARRARDRAEERTALPPALPTIRGAR
jgi:hypothetical protein